MSAKKQTRKVWVAALAVASVAALVGGSLTHRSPPPPTVASVPEAPAPQAEEAYVPDFVSFKIPDQRVEVRVVGEGLEVINTDPTLTGTNLTFSAVRKNGEEVPFSVTLPPPVAEL